MHADRRATSANDRRYEADKKAISAHGKRMSFGFGSRSESPILASGKHNAWRNGHPWTKDDVNNFSHENICADAVSTIKFIRRLGA